MKTLKKILITIAAFAISISANAQSTSATTVTEAIQVGGSCGMCKSRIEKAAKIEGVSKAEWNIKTHILSLSYDSTKVGSDAVMGQIAAAGHDTEKFKADDKTYSQHPGCCQYERIKK